MSLPAGPSIPELVATYRFIKKPYQLMDQCYREYGDIFSLKLLRLGQAVFIADPDVIRDIFTKHVKKFNAGETSSFLEPFLGEHSLLLLDGPEHARQRRLIAPAFHGERMRMFSDLMRDSTIRMVNNWKAGDRITLRYEMQELTLRVIIESVFGIEMSRRAPEIINHVRGMLQTSTFLTFIPLLRVDLGSWSPWGKFLKARANLDNLLYAEIDRRRANPPAEALDVVDMLMLSRDEEGNPMTPQEIRDECITLLLAGHETTALSLTWYFASLLHNPHIIEKLAEENRQVVGDNPLTLEMLPKLTYLDASIKESMRINNLFPIVGRRTIEPLELKGYELPVGTRVAPCNLLVHQLDSLYPEPHEFKPERFLNEKNIHPYGWFPFGGGNRRCIGMNFALFEMKILLATILPRVDLSLVPGQDFKPERLGLALSPKTGVDVTVNAVRPSAAPVPELAYQ